MLFKVFAGNIFCGELFIHSNYNKFYSVHGFIYTDNKANYKVKLFKRLKLIRIN